MSPALVLAVLAAGGAVWLIVPGPQTLRLEPQTHRSWPSWMAGRPDGLAPRQRVFAGLAAGLASSLVLGSGWGVLAGVVVALVTWVVSGRLEPASVRRRREQVAAQFGPTVDLLAATVAAGVPLRSAVVEVAAVVPEPTAGLLDQVAAQTRVGASDAAAWRCVSACPDRASWGRLASDLALAVESGSGMADLLHRHAEDGRRRRTLLVQRRARTVAVRSVLPLMCCFLPAFLLVGVVPIILGTFSKVFG